MADAEPAAAESPPATFLGSSKVVPDNESQEETGKETKEETEEERTSNRITTMLRKSKDEGAKRRRRITYTCCIAGAFGFVFGAAVHRAPFYFAEYQGEAASHPLYFIGMAMIFGSFSILLLGVLPSDLCAIRVTSKDTNE